MTNNFLYDIVLGSKIFNLREVLIEMGMDVFDNFIPQDVADLYEKLKNENLQGELIKEGDWLIWKLPNDIIVKISINPLNNEGYIDTFYLKKNGKERKLAHWHPMEDEIYKDLMDINNGQTIWVKKKSSIEDIAIIIDKKEYEAWSDRKKSKYIFL